MESANLKNFYYKLLLLFPLTTLFQSIPLLDWINRALFGGTLFAHIILQFYSMKIRKKWSVSFVLLLFVHAFALCVTSYPIYSVNMLFYFGFMYLYFMFFTDNKKIISTVLKRNISFVLIVIQIWNILVGISILFPSSYMKGWGGATYFVSYARSTFRLCPSALMISVLVLVYYCIKKQRSAIFYLIIPAFCFFMGGSRTYCGVEILVLIVFWYIFCSKRKYFYISLIPILMIFSFLVFNSAIGDKIEAQTYTESSYYDEMGTVTNGRTVFWEACLDSFSKENIYKKLFGCGFNYVYEVTYKAVHSRIWAHNDFINILLNFGYSGLGIYLYVIYALFKKYTQKSNIPFIVVLLVFLIWLINAMFNMFYTYFCSMICFPMLLLSLNEYFSKNIPIVKG